MAQIAVTLKLAMKFGTHKSWLCAPEAI